MSASDPLVTHLQQNSSRIARMLTPGKKSDQAQSPANFSPVAADFAGRKFQLAAQKMRILNADRMGHVLPADKPQIGSEIKARFAHVNQLLHLPTKTSNSSSNWSKVDMTVPRGGSPEKPQVSNDPGSMSAGSVIPRMSTFPKPGQSLDSFKDQVQRNQPTRKPAPVAPKIPRPAPKDRLFSRVQEMTPGSADSDNETGSEADSTPTPASPPPAASPAARSTVQRQPDTAPTRQVERKPATEPEPNKATREQKAVVEPLKTAREQKADGEPLKAALPSVKLSTPGAPKPILARAHPAPRKEKPEDQPARPPAALPGRPAQPASPAPKQAQIPQTQPLKSGQAAPDRPSQPEIQQKRAAPKQSAVEPVSSSSKAEARPSTVHGPERKPESASLPGHRPESTASLRQAEPKQAAAEPAQPTKKVESADSAAQKPQREPESKPALPLALPVRAPKEGLDLGQPSSPDKTARRPALPNAQPARKFTRTRSEAPSLPKARAARPTAPAYEPASQPHQLPLAKPGAAEGSTRKSSGLSTASPAQSAGASQNVIQRQPDASAPAVNTSPARQNRASAPTVTPQNRTSQAAPSHEPAASLPGQKRPASTAPAQPDIEKPAAPDSSLPKTQPAAPREPLQQRFEYRRLAAAHIKASPLAEQLTSPKTRPLIEPAPKPLVSARKYLPPAAPETASRATPFTSQAPVAQTRPGLSQAPATPASAGSTVMRQIEPATASRVVPPRMDLAKMISNPAMTKNMQTDQPAAAAKPQLHKPASSSFGPPPTKIAPPGTALTASPAAPSPTAPPQKVQHSGAHNVVQRAIDDSTQSGNVDQNISPPPQKHNTNPAADIEPLALKLLPYIKHLMEIEAERNGRLFR